MTLRSLLFLAAAATGVGLARGQTTQQDRVQPTNGAPATQSPSGASSGQQAGQRSANQNGAIGVRFDTAVQGQTGLRVASVDLDGPAAQAGLQAKDRILSADGRVFSQPRHLEAYLSAQAGRPVPLVIDRNGRQSTIDVMPVLIPGEHAWLGVLLEEEEQNAPNASGGQDAAKGQGGPNAPHAQNAPSRNGAEITQVAPGGPAARAGLRPGDVIIQFNGHKVDDAAELVADIREMKPQTKAELTVLRDNQEQKIQVTLGSRSEEYAEGPFGQAQFGPGQFPGHFPPGQFPPRQFPQGRSGPFAGGREFGNPGALLQLHQQLMDQNQRIEQELRQLRGEIKQLREQLQKKQP